jgi:hypothetical protein
MRRKKVEEETFHDASRRPRSETKDRPEQDRRWREALKEAKQSVFEVFEDRGPGVSIPPEGLTRSDHRGRR